MGDEVSAWYLLISLVCLAGLIFTLMLPFSDFNMVRSWILATIGGIFLWKGIFQ